MRALIKLVALAVWLPLVVTNHGADAAPRAALPTYCQLAPSANVWQGLGVGPGTTDAWEDPGNWSTGMPPTGPGADHDVCVPDGGVPRIAAGEEEHLTTLDVQSGATVTVDVGGKLFLYGNQGAGEDSVVRSGGRLEVVGGTFGGISRLHVLGTMTVENAGPGAAATVLTRDCAYDDTPGPAYPGEEPCTSPTPTPVSGPTGIVEVADGGAVVVAGGGVNIGDQFAFLVRGLLRVRAGAYIAADHGTRLELRPHESAAPGTGTLRFEGDGGYLEGLITEDTGISTLSTLVNQGLITKTGGDGRTVVSADYAQPDPGRVSVASGTLLLPDGSSTPAYVGGGVTYGTGRCAEARSPDCVPTTDAGFVQSAQLRVPPRDRSGADVVVRRLPRPSTAEDLGRPFEVHATALAASARRPAIITMRFDASILDGRRWPSVRVYHKSGTSPYRLVGACTDMGRPPGGATACVDRRGLAGSSRNLPNSSGAPDVLMVIRTISTSRWVGR
jgi:hypothetical protein